MPESFSSRLKHAWNAFTNKDPTEDYQLHSRETSYSSRPDRPRMTRGNERSIINAVCNRIAMDVASITINHVRLDENGRFSEVIESGLNNCLNVEANLDQTGRAFLQDAVLTLLDEGCIAIVPIDTTIDPRISGSYEINTMRVGKVIDWRPERVQVRVYNEKTGLKEDVYLPKKAVAIVENPLYAVMNDRNSTLTRLVRKLNLLDVVDEQSSSGKLDLIIQLPYIIKTPARKQQADNRRKEIENQLANSKYGIAYADGTERITQLNRPIENNLLKTVEYLTNMLYSQLGISQAVMDGTADEKQMLNYNNRTIEPIISAITDEMRRKFLTKTARSQRQTIMFFKDPFRLVPVDNLAEIADKFTRNEIVTSNEFRQIIGMKPSDDPKADQLVNSNIAQPVEEEAVQEPVYEDEVQTENEGMDDGSEEVSIMDMPVSGLG